MGAPSLSSTGAAAAVARGLRQRKRGAQQPSSRSFASQSARRQPAPQSPSARSVGEADSSFSPSALFRAAASAFPPSSPPPSSAASPPVSSQSPPSLSGLPPPLGASWRAVALAQETARRPLSPVGAFPQPASASSASSSFPSLPPPGGYPSSPSPPYSSSSPSLPRPPGASPPSLTRAQQPPPSSLPHGAAHRPPLPPRRLLQGVRPRAAPGSALPQGLPCPAGVLQAASGAFSAPSFLSPPHPSFAPSPPWKGSPSGKLDDGLAHVSLPANPTFEDRLFFSLLPLVQGVECPAAGPPAGDKARTARPRPRASDRGRSPSPAAGQQPDAQAKEALELLQTKRTLLLQLYAIIYGEAASPQRGSASVASAYLRPAPAQAAQLARSPLSAAVLSNTLPDFRRLASASTWTPKALRALTEKYGSLADLAQTPRRDNSPSPQVWLALFYTLQRMGPKDSYDRLFLFFLRALLPSFPHFFEAPPSSAFAAAEETPAERVGEGARQKEEAAQARRVAGGQTRARSGRDYEPLFLRFDPETLLPLTEALARARLPYASLFCLQGGLSLYGAQLVKTEADAQLALRILRGIALSLADQIKFPRQAPLRAQKLPSAPGSPTSSGSPTPPAPPSSPAPSQETFAGAAAPWKSPRTVDEPHTEGGYGRASYAVLAAWQQLWLLYQRLPDVAPASKISFFLQSLPWAAPMQRTCDEVYANMPTDVASLAALAYSVRMRQTYLFRLLQLFQEAEKRERERVRRGTEARAALAALAEDQRQAGARFPPSVYPEALSVSLPSVSQLSGAASSSVSSPAGSPSSSPALAATGVPLGSATASSLAWRSRVLGAAPLLPPCGLGDELEGEWTQLAAGLWSGKGLFGDGIDFLQAAHELLSDWSFLWAMPCEAEPVWLKLAAFASRLQHLGMPSLDARAPPSSSPQPVSLTSPSSGSAETGEAADRAAAAGGVADLPARERGESEKGVGGGAQAGDAEVAKGESPKEGQVVPWQMRFQRELETEIAKRARLAHARQRHTQFAAPSHSPSAPSEALAYEMQQRAGEEESEAEWLSLPRTLVALEHLYCRAAHEFCRAPQHAVEQFVRTRPRDFIMLMLVSSFPPPSRRVHTPPPPALAASTSSSLKPALSSLLLPPSSVSTSQRLASSCFIPCRHPAAPPLFFQFQNLIPRLPPLRQDERDDRGVYVAALTLLAVRWRWVCAWASDTSQAANARGPSPVLPLLRFEHFMKAVSVIYSEALYAARLLLPHQQERYLLLQQLLRHLNYTPHNRITLQQLATQGGPRAAANVVCMLAATRDMHAATGLRHSLFEVLSSLLSKLFVKGIFFWPSRSTGAPFLPYPLALSPTRELLPPSEPASSGSSCFSSRPVRVGEVVFPPSPVTLLPYLHLVALDSAQARSVNPRDSYLRRLIRLYQVFFEAALRTPGKEGAGPRQLLTRESPLQPALTAASSASAGGDIVQTAASTPDARVRAASEKRKRQTEGGAASAEGKEARPSEKNDANEEDLSTLYGLTEAAFHRSWAVPLVLQADVDRALHLPLLLPHLLNIWKEKLDARRYSALRSLLFRSSSPKDQADGGAEGPYVEASRDSLVANAEEAPHPGKRHSAPQVAQEFDDGYASEEETKNAHLRITPTAASSAAPSTKPLSPELAVSTLVLFLCRAARIPLPEQLQAPQPAAEAAARRRAEKNLQDEHARDPATGAVADIGGEISAGSSKQASRVEKEEASAAENKPEKEMTAEGSREAASSSNAAAGLRDEARLSGGEQTNETSSSVLFEEDDDADLSLASLSFDADGNLFIPAEEGGSDEAEQTTAPSKKGKKNQVREGTPPASAPTADTASSSPTEPYTIEATQGELEKEAANTDAHDEVEDVFATSHTLDPSRFAEPLRHLTLTTLATGMTVLDEELQCLNEVVHRVNAKFPAAQAAEAEELVAKDSFLAACFRPFPSLASYQAALSALYDVFDFLFVEKLSACSVAELQLLALNTRRLIKLPRYLPFPSRDDGRSPAAGEPSAGSTPEDEATRAQEDGETFERRGEAEPMRTVSGEDLERARNGGERADARLPVSRETERHEPQVLQARRWADATRDRREFFYGSIMQALVLRLTKLNAALQCHSSPSASSARGEEAATDAHQQVRTAPAGRTREATSLQEEQAVALFELLLHMLAGSPLPVQRELLLLLLQRSGVAAEVGASTAADAEESDGLRSVVGSSHPQSASEGDPLSENHKLLLHIGKPFELLLRDIASMSESQLFRLALAIARLDLLGCLFDAHPEGGRRRGSVAAADLACFSSTAPFLAPRAFSLPAATLAGAGDAKHLVDPDAAQPEKTQLLESDSSRRGADTGCSSSRALSANLHLLLAPETTHGAPCEAPEAGEPPEHRRLRKQQARQERTRRDEKRRAARLLQRELEGALRAKLAFGWETLSFSEATGLLWALTVMPEPKLDLLVLLFDRIESSFNVVLEEQRIIEQPTDLPSHLPPLTSGPIYRFLATHTPVDSARLRSACAALLREGDPAVVSSLQARFPLCWVALEVLASTRFHQERSVFADSSAASNIERTLEEDERAGEWDDAHGDSAKHPRASAVVTPLAQSVIRMAQTKHGISLLWDTDFQIPGLPFIFDLALPNERIVFLLGSHCASLPLEEGSSSYDSLSCISGLEPDLVVATPTLPLVVQSGDEATQEGGERAVQWELAECVVGPPRSGMNEIGEQKQRFRDAGSCGGRRLIRRLTEQAGYRLIEIDTPDATHAETLLDRLLTSSAGERVSRAHVATPLKAGGVPLPR